MDEKKYEGSYTLKIWIHYKRVAFIKAIMAFIFQWFLNELKQLCFFEKLHINDVKK